MFWTEERVRKPSILRSLKSVLSFYEVALVSSSGGLLYTTTTTTFKTSRWTG